MMNFFTFKNIFEIHISYFGVKKERIQILETDPEH